MELFCIIVAAIFVAFLFIVLTIYLLFRFVFGRLLRQFANMALDATKGIVPFMQPLRIVLQREVNWEWHDNAAVKRIVKPLKAAGFEDAGVYSMDEVPDVSIQALAQPEKSVYAVVYEHPDKGVWFEVVSRYENGAALSCSTAEETGLDRPPNNVVERFDPDTDPVEVYDQHLKRRPDKDLLPASTEGFKNDFERAYAAEMDWRFERGGFTEDEVRNNLKLLGDDTTDQQVKQVHAMQQVQVNQWLQTKLIENYRAKANIPDSKWRRVEHRMMFVHDRLIPTEVHGLFTSCLDWDDDEDAAQESADKAEKLSEELPAREAFEQMIEMLPEDRALKKVGHLTQPVAADVYLCPAAMFDGDYD